MSRHWNAAGLRQHVVPERLSEDTPCVQSVALMTPFISHCGVVRSKYQISVLRLHALAYGIGKPLWEKYAV